MKNLFIFFIVFFVTTTLFAKKGMHINARHKNLEEEHSCLLHNQNHENDMIHIRLMEEEKAHMQELEKPQSETTYKGQTNEQDSLALVSLYNSTNGDNWINKTGWLTGNVADWYGIYLDVDDRVYAISLFENKLIGSIPPEIGNLSNLKYLYLHYNQLNGNIPTEIGDLTSLTRLYLPNNQLTGSIPAEIGNLSNLNILELNNNELTGSIPIEISNLTSLGNLYLHENQFEELPDLSALTNLFFCYINNNAFDFGDLERANITANTFNYTPQSQISVNRSENSGQITFTFNVDGSNNQYQWYNAVIPHPTI